MAGSRASSPEIHPPRRVGVRCLAVMVGLAIGGLVAGPAHAQVPSLPDTPDLPPIPAPIADAIDQAEEILIPIIVDAAIQSQVVSNAAGFALRPPCSAAGTVILLVAIAGGSLPLPVAPGVIVTPVLIFCGGAYTPGPADPVFQQVDDAAGDQLQDAVQPVLTQAGDALAPVRPNLMEACGAIALAGGTPRQLPPPLSRFDIVKEVCTP